MNPLFTDRLIEPEIMDHVPPEEARPNLADLVRINRILGGHSVLRKMLPAIVKTSEPATFLDVGAASGDTARLVRELYPDAFVVSLDYNSTNLEKAPLPKVIADAFALPFGPRTFDYVLSSLFLHHFENFQVVALLREFYAIANKGLLVCDLERHVLPYLFMRTTKPIFRWNEITVQDGLKSVRAAFRRGELEALAEEAGIANPKVVGHRPAFRLALTAVR